MAYVGLRDSLGPLVLLHRYCHLGVCDGLVDLALAGRVGYILLCVLRLVAIFLLGCGPCLPLLLLHFLPHLVHPRLQVLLPRLVHLHLQSQLVLLRHAHLPALHLVRQEGRQVVVEAILILKHLQPVRVQLVHRAYMTVSLRKDGVFTVEGVQDVEQPRLVGRLLAEDLHQEPDGRHHLGGEVCLFWLALRRLRNVVDDHLVGGRVGYHVVHRAVDGLEHHDLVAPDEVHELDRDDALLVGGEHPAVLQHGLVVVLLAADDLPDVLSGYELSLSHPVQMKRKIISSPGGLILTSPGVLILIDCKWIEKKFVSVEIIIDYYFSG